jgi:hypothetical protein
LIELGGGAGINDYRSLQVACTILLEKGDETECVGQSKRTKKDATEKIAETKAKRQRTNEKTRYLERFYLLTVASL